MCGLVAILTIPSARHDKLCELATAMICRNKIGALHLPCAQGKPSPFDSLLYQSITLNSIHSLAAPPIHIRRLKSNSHQIDVAPT